MSRTYRKNRRCITKFDGFLINSHDDHVSNGYYRYDRETGGYSFGASYQDAVLIVPDVDAYGYGVGGKSKQLHHQIDRARYKAALYRDPDNVWVNPSYNIRDYT